MTKKKKRSKKIWIAAFIILAVFFAASRSNLFLISDFDTEPGWTPYGEFKDRFSNPIPCELNGDIYDSKECCESKTVKCGSTCTKWNENEMIYYYPYLSCWESGGFSMSTLGKIVDNDYWTIDIKSNSFNEPQITGGDRNLKVSGGAKYLWQANIKTKQSIYSKKFKFDYEFLASPSGTSVVSLSVGGLNGLFSKSTTKKGSGEDIIGSVEILPSTIDPTIIEVLVDGISQGETQITKDTQLEIGVSGTQGGVSSFRIINPRYSPLFGCEIDNDEVPVFIDFAEGSEIYIDENNTLSGRGYPIRKFCYNRNPIIRTFETQGLEEDYKSEIFEKLSSGETLVVPENQVWRIPYTTIYQEGMDRDCDIGQAVNINTGECEFILSEGVIDDPEPGTEIQTINVGTNEVLYTQRYDTSALEIGDYNLKGSTPSFTCCSEITEDGWIDIGEPRDECWKTSISGNSLYLNEMKTILPYIDVEYTLAGSGVYKGYKSSLDETFDCEWTDQEDWTNYFKITFDNTGIELSFDQEDYIFKLNEESYISVEIDNKITNFQDAGIKIRTTTKLLDTVKEDYHEFELKKGDFNYSLPIKTDSLGDVTAEIIPYIEIQNKKLYDDDKLIFNYQITQSGEPDNNTVYVEKDKIIYIEKEHKSFFEKIWEWIKGLFS